MLRSKAFETETVLYWDIENDYTKGDKFTVFKDGEKIATTENSHFYIKNLKENNEYSFSVNDKNEKEIGNIKVSTPPKKKRIDITASPYFAKGDGETKNTEIIQKAFDECGPDEYIYFPKGDFKTGALRLHSNTEIYIEKGATLHGTAEIEDYLPKIKSRFEGIEMDCYSSLLNIGSIENDRQPHTENITIRGEGTIMCDGEILSQKIIVDEKNKSKNTHIDYKNYKFDVRDLPYGRVRPRLINISCAKNIVICGVDIKDGASWNVHIIYSKNILTFGCKFYSEKVHNGDGWDPDSSENCTIFDCEFFTGDDSIAIKSGKNPQGNIIAIPTKNISIFDCISRFGHGITIGSEISGGVSNVKIWHCDLVKSAYGIEIKATKKRGGYVKNVTVKNCRVCHILLHSVAYNDDGEPAKNVPTFENCTFSQIDIYNNNEEYSYTNKTSAIEISGFDNQKGRAKNIKLKDITLDQNAKIDINYCQNISIENVTTK